MHNIIIVYKKEKNITPMVKIFRILPTLIVYSKIYLILSVKLRTTKIIRGLAKLLYVI